MANRGLHFAYQIGAVGAAGMDDRTLYREAIADARLLQEKGFDSAWMVEHHFSDYYPQPNPFLFLSHIAAACPGLGLGTSVMVLPWYDPIRFAEDLAMLVNLTEGEFTERELMLIKLRAVGKEREEMKRMADIFRGRIIDVTERSYTIELTGNASKLDAFIRAVDRVAILETVRTGSSGIGRGERILRL